MANQSFTDDPKVAGSTQVKTLHIQELKDAINTWTTTYGLPSQVTSTITGTVSAPVVNEIINGLNYINANKTSCASGDTWTSLTTVSSGDIITVLKANTMVANMKIAQDKYCAACDSGATGYQYTTCSTCNQACHSGYSYSPGGCSCGDGGGGYGCCNVCNYPQCLNYCSNRYGTFPFPCHAQWGCYPCNSCYNDQPQGGCLDYSAGYYTCDTEGPDLGCTKCYSAANRYPWS